MYYGGVKCMRTALYGAVFNICARTLLDGYPLFITFISNYEMNESVKTHVIYASLADKCMGFICFFDNKTNFNIILLIYESRTFSNAPSFCDSV